MPNEYVYVKELRQQARPPEKGILSQTLQQDAHTKVVLFGFAAGEELSPHRAPFPATLVFLKGEARVKLGDDEQDVAEGAFVYMPAHLEHGIHAKTELVMLLTMIRGAAGA